MSLTLETVDSVGRWEDREEEEEEEEERPSL